MAMSHESCTHPRDPKGRAWCRANGGPGSGAVWGSLPDNEPTMVAARTGRKKPVLGEQAAEIRANREPKPIAVTRPAINPQRVAKAVTPVTTTGLGILTTLPGVFRVAADWARSNLCLVTTYMIKDQKMVCLTNARGKMTMTWRPSLPDGVWAVSFKPDNSSVTTKLGTVNEGLELLRG